ncbi:short chain dehydrogenase [Colletotrichum musicola]|uniref:Short chain dehydrogenase n=1 Tax=Colletotrichum musicola TaxID=2175873 RepID=A0A8H6KEA7_9PEZI|nr:short chain dehydrogenase [Colletotrichum musicola]
MTTIPVILVTAGSAGLGSAVSRLFSKHGYRVIVNYSANKVRADELVSELNAATASSGGHLAIQADMSSRPDIERLVQETYQATSRIDVIFSNAGWSQFRDTTRLDNNCFDEDWDFAYTTDVKSHLWLLHAARDHLAENEGCFVTTSSIAGISGMGSSLAYCVSKAAQIHMVKGLATMVGPSISVNSISPGLLLTDWSKRFSDEQKEEHKSQTRLKRFARLEDIAEQVLCLARNQSITGVYVTIDAGCVR